MSRTSIILLVVILVLGVAVAKTSLSMARRERAQSAAAEYKYTAVRPAPAAASQPEKGAELTGADLAKCLKSGKPTLADFGEGWCEQCKKMVPVLAAATRQYKGKANVVFVDTKAYPEHAQTYKIVRIPTQIFFDVKGKEVNRHIGYYPLEDVAKEMAKVGVGK